MNNFIFKGELKMKNLIKKWWFYAIVVLVIVIIILLINNKQTIYYEYKEQVISVLIDYKNGELDLDTTADKIDNIRKKIDKEIENDTKSNNKTKETATSFSDYLRIYALSFVMTEKEKTNSEINEIIDFIKKDVKL